MTTNLAGTARLRDDELAVLGRPRGEYLIIGSVGDFERACGLARGDYQLDLLTGHRSWAGSDLKGKAGRYSDRYRTSREALLDRMAENGIKSRFVLTRSGRKVLVVGEPSAHQRLADFRIAAVR